MSLFFRPYPSPVIRPQGHAEFLDNMISLWHHHSMPEPDLSELRAMESVLTAIHSLKTEAQVRVLRWVTEQLELGLDMRIAFRKAAPTINRSYIELAYERASHGLNTPSEFLAEVRPRSIVDRVLTIATCLQMRSDDPDKVLLTARDINAVLRSVGRPVTNVTDCLNTLTHRNPPHISRHALTDKWRGKHGYRVTEAGIDHVYKMIVFRDDDNEKAR
jgi:hypothetical protein